MGWHEQLYGRRLLWPALALFAVLYLLPSILGFYYAMTDWNAMSEKINFIGLANFREYLGDDANWLVIKNTAIYAFFSSLFKCALGLMLALALNEAIKSRNLLRTIWFMPVIVSNLILGLMFQQVFHPDHGILNAILRAVGLGSWSQAWIADARLAIWSATAVEVWKAAGFNMVIFLAGLQVIPKEVLEAANIDGASYGSKLWHIILPYLVPTIVINMLLNIISGLKTFDTIFALTNGGPGNASEVINISVFKQFSLGSYGYGTAIGVLLFVILGIFSLGVIRFYVRHEEEDS